MAFGGANHVTAPVPPSAHTRVWESSGMQELGGYYLVRRLGTGGMGTVWEAVDADGMHVALKVLHPAVADDPEARARLAREVRLLHRVRGRGVARVLDAELDEPEAFLVTELIEGPTLEQDVESDGPFNPTELAGLARGLAEALTLIHAHGVMHRDLKPGNVMMSRTGPVLIDFGIAQVQDDTRLTVTGMVAGTPGYLDPAVFNGADPSPAGDWWALAAVLTFAATGRRPFGTGPALAVMKRVSEGAVDVDGVPAATALALTAALQPDPTRRLEPDVLLDVLDHKLALPELRELLQERGLLVAPTEILAGPQPVTGQELPGTIPPAVPAAATDATAAVPPNAVYADDASAVTELVESTPNPEDHNGGSAAAPTQIVGPVPVPQQPWPTPAESPAMWTAPEIPAAHPAFVPPQRQPWVTLGFVLLVVAAAGVWPVVSGAVMLVAMTVAATSGYVRLAARNRIARHGQRRADAARATVAFPFLVLKAALRSVSFGAVGVGVGWLGLLATSSNTVAVLWGAASVTAALLWWGPGAGAAQEGAHVLQASLFPAVSMQVVIVLLTVLLAALGILAAWTGALPVSWWPMLQAPEIAGVVL